MKKILLIVVLYLLFGTPILVGVVALLIASVFLLPFRLAGSALKLVVKLVTLPVRLIGRAV